MKTQEKSGKFQENSIFLNQSLSEKNAKRKYDA